MKSPHVNSKVVEEGLEHSFEFALTFSAFTGERSGEAETRFGREFDGEGCWMASKFWKLGRIWETELPSWRFWRLLHWLNPKTSCRKPSVSEEGEGVANMFCSNWNLASCVTSECSLRALFISQGFVKLLTIFAASKICCRLVRRFRWSVLGRWVTGSNPICKSFFLKCVFHRFLISLSVLPGRWDAIAAHLIINNGNKFRIPKSCSSFK